jgi:diguanylate cyclase (GGDEF)-like protein
VSLAVTIVVGATIAAPAVALAGLAVRHQRLTARFATLCAEARLDPLTGVANRRALAALPPAFAGRRNDVWVAYGDLDGFKQVNEVLGHGAGDRVLVEVAMVITAAVRPGDIVCRVGGDEFVVLLAGCSESDAHAVAERIRRQVATLGNNQHFARCSISLGLCVAGPTLATLEAIGEADRALRMAKSAGGDQVMVAPTLRW